jgi:DNA repair protein RecO (recombination protein O)
LFDAYRHLLQQLASDQAPQALLRVFEKQLLEAIGFGMQLTVEPATGEIVQPDGWYRYDPASGPRRESREVGSGAGESVQTVSGQEPAPDKKLVSGAALLALESGQIEESQLLELKWLMRRVLRFHLGDKPLVSQTLFK